MFGHPPPRLDQAIASYRSIVTLSEDRPELVSPRLLRAVGDTLVDKLRFRGERMLGLVWVG